jgi:hypothetical protein
MYNILRVSSFYREKVVRSKKNSDLLIRNFNSRTQKNSPNRLAKVVALMVGGMFMVVAMSY